MSMWKSITCCWKSGKKETVNILDDEIIKYCKYENPYTNRRGNKFTICWDAVLQEYTMMKTDEKNNASTNQNSPTSECPKLDEMKTNEKNNASTNEKSSTSAIVNIYKATYTNKSDTEQEYSLKSEKLKNSFYKVTRSCSSLLSLEPKFTIPTFAEISGLKADINIKVEDETSKQMESKWLFDTSIKVKPMTVVDVEWTSRITEIDGQPFEMKVKLSGIVCVKVTKKKTKQVQNFYFDIATVLSKIYNYRIYHDYNYKAKETSDENGTSKAKETPDENGKIVFNKIEYDFFTGVNQVEGYAEYTFKGVYTLHEETGLNMTIIETKIQDNSPTEMKSEDDNINTKEEESVFSVSQT